jgi:hypothetical protein
MIGHGRSDKTALLDLGSIRKIESPEFLES